MTLRNQVHVTRRMEKKIRWNVYGVHNFESEKSVSTYPCITICALSYKRITEEKEINWIRKNSKEKTLKKSSTLVDCEILSAV